MIMYGVYNSDTLTALIRTVHNMQNTTTWKERTFAGKLNQIYQAYLNKEGAHKLCNKFCTISDNHEREICQNVQKIY